MKVVVESHGIFGFGYDNGRLLIEVIAILLWISLTLLLLDYFEWVPCNTQQSDPNALVLWLTLHCIRHMSCVTELRSKSWNWSDWKPSASAFCWNESGNAWSSSEKNSAVILLCSSNASVYCLVCLSQYCDITEIACIRITSSIWENICVLLESNCTVSQTPETFYYDFTKIALISIKIGTHNPCTTMT